MEATVYLEDNEYIALCDLLKLAGLAESGGQAKAFIAEGLVLRNGETETRKTAKIRGGEVIEFGGARLEITDGYDPEEESRSPLGRAAFRRTRPPGIVGMLRQRLRRCLHPDGLLDGKSPLRRATAEIERSGLAGRRR